MGSPVHGDTRCPVVCDPVVISSCVDDTTMSKIIIC
jgi:hypothetical protein